MKKNSPLQPYAIRPSAIIHSKKRQHRTLCYDIATHSAGIQTTKPCLEEPTTTLPLSLPTSKTKSHDQLPPRERFGRETRSTVMHFASISETKEARQSLHLTHPSSAIPQTDETR